MRRLALLLALPLAIACGAPADDPGEDEGTSEIVDTATADADETAAMKADAPGLSSAQTKTVLTLLDNVCGDTWCEGDFNWQFKKLACRFDEKRCTITFLINEHGNDTQQIWRACRMTGLSSYASMVKSGELVERFYGKVDACVTRIEAALPR